MVRYVFWNRKVQVSLFHYILGPESRLLWQFVVVTAFWLLKETRIECPFHIQIPQAKKQVLWGSQKITYICSKQKHVSWNSWNICLKRLVSNMKSNSLKVPFHLMSFDPAWCLQRIFLPTAQHQFARASLIFAHDPTWRESSIKWFGLPNGKRL